MKIKAYAAHKAVTELKALEYELANIGKEEVDIKDHYCGVCHSDMSIINNE